jgi:hypothetical protein
MSGELGMLTHLCAAIALVGGILPVPTQGGTGEPSVLRMDRTPYWQDTLADRKRMVKIQIRFARAADISEALGGSVLGLDRTRVDQQVSTWGSGWNSGAQGLLPAGIDALIAFVPDNTLIVRFTDEDSLKELVDVVKGLDVRPRCIEVLSEAQFVYTDRSGRRTRSLITARGSTVGERRIHLKSRKKEAAPLLDQISDVDIYARLLDDGRLHVASDWHVSVTVAGTGKSSSSTASSVYRADATADPGKPVTTTSAVLSLASGKVEFTLRLTPRLLDGGATHEGRPLSTQKVTR